MATEKVWQYAFNDLLIVDAANTDRARHQVWYYYDFLTRPGLTGAWTVVGSSDAVTGGMDNVDRWTHTFVPGKFVWNNNGSAHSWVCLRSPAALGPVYLVIAYDKAGFWEQVSWYLSYALPTGGSNLQNPTLAAPFHTYASVANDANTANFRMHGTMAADGSFFIAMGRDLSNVFNGLVTVNTLTEPRTGDLKNVIMGGQWTQSGVTTAFFDSFKTLAPDSTEVAASLISPVYGSARTDLLTGMNQDTTELKYLDWPAYAFVTTPAKRSIKGRVQDLRLVVGGLAHGTVEPSIGSPEQVTVGPVWIPCDTTPIL